MRICRDIKPSIFRGRNLAWSLVLLGGVLAGVARGEELHWSFRPIERPSVPPAEADWGANAIDAFVRARLEDKQLGPSPPASRTTLIRRLYLVTLGLPPSLEEVDRFVHDDRPGAWQRVVDKALASPRYGERWAQHWFDIVRYAESDGFEGNPLRKQAWHYRDYVIDSFNSDLPYDRFISEQLAGDAMGVDLGTAYLVAGARDRVTSPDPVLTMKQRQDELADIINTTGTAFVGLTLGCARCHDHKFDPVSQKDYYAMAAVFAGVRHGQRKIPPTEYVAQRIEELDAQIIAKWQGLYDQLPAAGPDEIVFLDEGSVWSGRGVAYLRPCEDLLYPNRPPEIFPEDPATVSDPADLSGGRYGLWRDTGKQPVIAYQPLVRGPHQVLVSWATREKEDGAGRAQYLLDEDGSLDTSGDRKVLLEVDQSLLADGSTSRDAGSVWSGLCDAGIVDLEPQNVLLLQAADGTRSVSADLVACRSVPRGETAKGRLRSMVNAARNVEVFEPVEARFVRLTIHETSDGEDAIVDELEVFSAGRNVALAANGGILAASSYLTESKIHKLEFLNDGLYGNEHSWRSGYTGHQPCCPQWVQIELPEPTLIEHVEWGRARTGTHRDAMPTLYTLEVALEKDQWQTVSTSGNRVPYFVHRPVQPELDADGLSEEARQSWQQLLEARTEEAVHRGGLSYVGKFAQPGPTHLLYRGDAMQKREPVVPGAIESLGSVPLPPDSPEQSRRVRFASWIVAHDNPLTARVIVNRIWQHHFGIGMVDTPSDFGSVGTRPTHPLLLDYLADELKTRGWSLKHIHRLILTSETFQQDSRPRQDSMAVDGDSRFLWRFPPRRLEAEGIRDAVCCASGRIDFSMGGPGFSGFDIKKRADIEFLPKDEYGPEDFRRMIYMTRIRQEEEPVFGLFDCPDATQVMGRRGQTTTALQVFNLSNSTFMIQQSRLMADRLEGSTTDHRQAAALAYRLAFGRDADLEELDQAAAFSEQMGLWMLCRALFNANEFLMIP